MRPNSMSSRSPWLVLAVLSLAGCASTKAGKGAEVEGPKATETPSGSSEHAATPVTPAAEAAPKVSAHAQALFDDALKSYDVMKKAKTFDFPSLEKKFQAAAEADGHLGEADYDLGVLAERQGKVDEAVRHYREALRKKPTLRQAAENIGVIAQNAGNEDEAVKTFENILQSYPDDGGSRARLAEVYRRKGDCEKAVDLAKQALFREPKTLPAYKVLMLCAYAQKQYSMAKLVALRATRLDENDPEIFHTLGLISLAEKDPAKALAQFKTAVEKRPDYLPSHLLLAKVALDQHNYPGAEVSLRRVLQADPKNLEAHLDLGVAYKGMGHLDKAMEEYEAAKALNPNLPAIYLNQGQIVSLRGNPEKAIEMYRQYVQLSGANEVVAQDLIKESEGVIQKREEDKKAAEEAKKMEEEMKKQEDAAKVEEKRQKDEELKKQQGDAKGADVKPADSPPAADPKAKCLENAKTAKERKACEGGSALAGKAPAAPKAEEPKREPVKAAPKKPGASGDEPTD